MGGDIRLARPRDPPRLAAVRLTVEEHREAIKRYGHIGPARAWGVTSCAAKCPGTTRTCTRERGHGGPHVAHGLVRRVLAVWDTGAGAQRSSGAVRPESGARGRYSRVTRKPVGLRTKSPVGVLEALRRLGARAISSADEIVFIILFIVFVKVAIDVLLSLG